MITNSKTPSVWQRLLLALLIVAVASAIRVLLLGSLGKSIPFLVYYPAVMVAAVYGGLLSGFLATALSSVLIFFWIMQGFMSPAEVLAMAIFIVSCTLISYVCETMRQSQAQAQISQEKTERVNEKLRDEIIQRKKAEEAMRENEARFRVTYEQAAVGMAHVAPSGHWLMLNQKVCSILGYSHDELLPLSFQDITHPDDLSSDLAQMQRLLAGEIEAYAMEKRFFRKDGTIVWVNLTVSLTRQPSGEPDYFISVIEDITTRKRADMERERFFTLSLDLLAIAGTDGYFRRLNPAFEKTLGFSATEMLERPFLDFLHPDDVESTTSEVLRLQSGAQTINFENRYLCKDGSYRWLRWKAAPFVEDGTLYCVARDVTDSKSIEEINQRYAAIIASSDDAIISKTLEGIITSWNPGAERLFGYPAKEMIGQPMSLLIPAEHPNEEAEIILTIMRGEHVDHLETERLHKDGRRVAVSATISPIIDMRGEFIGASSIMRDIAERKRAEEVLRESQRILKLTLDSANIGYWDLDITTNSAYRSLKHDQIFGYDELLDSWTYEQFLTYVHVEDRKRVDQLFQEGVASKTTWNIECRIIRRDNVMRWIWVRGNVFTNEDGEATRMLGMVLDITERKQIESEIHELNATLERRVEQRTIELESANKDLEAFTYSVSHDLRAPVRAMIGFTRILSEEHGEQLSEEAMRYLQRVSDNAQKMGNLVDDLLTFSRLGRQSVSRQNAAPEKIVQRVWEELATERQGRPIEFHVSDLPPCRADLALLQQVFFNLIANALKFTRGREPAKIEVGYHVENGENVYFVKDNGAGFDMLYVGKLFGVFQRLHSAKEFEGTGVGLAIVQRIVQRHGGRIWAESEIDKGATFYFFVGKETTDE